MKWCGRCRLEKPLEDFNKCAANKFGLHNHCRECQKQVRRQWYEIHRLEEIECSRLYMQTPDGIAARQRTSSKNKDAILARNRIRRSLPAARVKANVTRNRKYATDPNFRIAVNLRSRVRTALRGIRKGKKTLELLGCSISDFRKHLESMFVEGMSWETYGPKGWHIDHIMPCASFDLSDPKQLEKCFHFTNCQPLWYDDNIRKHDKIGWER